MRPLVNKTPIGMNEEFEEAIKPYMHCLRKYCLSLTKSKWDGEDLMQETLVKAYKSWLKKPNAIAKAYLFRIASNTWIDRHRKRKLDEDLNKNMAELKHEDEPIADTVYQAISVLLTKLSSKQRVIVLLMEGFGYTVKETADILSVSEGSIKAALHRARKRLKNINDCLNDDVDLEEDVPLAYVTALRNGNPGAVIQLYQAENNTPVMSTIRSKHDVHSPILSVGNSCTFYVVVSMPKKNGGTLFMPFYRQELAEVLHHMAWLSKKELSKIA